MIVSAGTITVLLAICCGGLAERTAQVLITGRFTDPFLTPASLLNENSISNVLNSVQNLAQAQLDPLNYPGIRNAAEALKTLQGIRNLPNLRTDNKNQETIADSVDPLESEPTEQPFRDLGKDVNINYTRSWGVTSQNKVPDGQAGGDTLERFHQSLLTQPSLLNWNTVSSALNSVQNHVSAQLDTVRNMVQPAVASAEEIARKYGPQLGDIARNLILNIQDRDICDAAEALKTFEEIYNLPNLRIDNKDQETIANALDALYSGTTGEPLQGQEKDASIVDTGSRDVALLDKVQDGFRDGNWEPVFLELNSLSQSIGKLTLPYFLITLLPLAMSTALPTSLGFMSITLTIAAASSATDPPCIPLEAFRNLVIPVAD